MSLLDFAGHLLASVPILLALLALRLGNQKKAERVRQFPMPVLAVLYAIIAMVVLYRVNAWLGGWLAWLMRLIPVVRDWYSSVWLYFLENLLVLVVFLVLKLLLKPILAGLSRGSAFRGHQAVEGVYEWDSDYELWFVRPSTANLRGLFRGFLAAGLVITVGYTALITSAPQWPGALAIAYPALITLVLGEIVWFLSGVTKDEYVTDILGEDDEATRVANYGLLRQVLDRTFGDRVLAEELSLSTLDATRSRSRIDRLVDEQAGELETLAGAYFQRLRADGDELDINLLDASVRLLRKQSVVIANPFHGDLTPYLAFPAHYHLLQHRKVLIVAGREAATAEYRDWIAAGLESVTGIGDLWSVQVLGTTPRDDLDVGVLRFADLHNMDLLREHDAFLGQVEYVILAEPSRLLATGQLGLGLVLQRVGRRGEVVYAAFDRNHDGLVDALSHLLKVELADVVASALPTGATSEMVWQAEGPSMHTAILPAITRYLGLGTELAAVALKYQVERVSWVGGDRFPVRDMTWLAGQYYGPITAFAELDLTQSALGEALVPVASPWSVERAPRQFLVVEDEINNVFESLRLYATRARTEGFVNLIAGDYLLRDYMIANREIFAADPKAIPSIVPDFARTERNGVLRLLLTMLAFDVNEFELTKQLQLLGVTVSNDVATDDGNPDSATGEGMLVDLFKELVLKHTGVSDIRILAEREAADGEGTLPRFRVEPSKDLDGVLQHLRAAYFFVEDEREDSSYIGALLYGHVYQAMLPGQFLTHGGKYYEVQAIGNAHHRDGVVLRRAADHIRDRRVYKQIRTFTLRDLEANPISGARFTVDRIEAQPHAEGRLNESRIELLRSFATISVSTVGYLEMPSRSALAEAHRIGVDDVPTREYRHKEVLEIRLPEVDASTRRTIVVVLNELFVSVFPNAHEYVTALTADQGDEAGDLLDDLVVDGRPDSIFIVEDSLVDLGLVVAVERNWRRLLEIVTDYLLWRETPVPPEPQPEPLAKAEPDFPEVPKTKRGAVASVLRALGGGIAALSGLVARLLGLRRPNAYEPHQQPAEPAEPPAALAVASVSTSSKESNA
ncbi:hypothetical protein [Naasia aerilata]|uniref:Uncharacterized protein n=1 Tax=Naasia aerilata TaxID=1162966 RepID=A0ABN6XQQ7_9MICO|nr:hypothetical protein [Naasia aerilata]BDZ47184.1 hypothetical protein GCM10025866_30930 [Naasia aerilata]